MSKEYIKKSKVKELAIANNYDYAVFYTMWSGFSVYVAETKSNEILCIGYPSFILVDENNNARFADIKEIHEIMDADNLMMDADRILDELTFEPINI